MTELRMQPGDTLIVDDEEWTYPELLDQLAVQPCNWGAHGGTAVPPHRIAWAKQERQRGRSARFIASALGVTERTVHRYLRRVA